MTIPLWEFPGVQFDVLVTFNGAYCYDKNRVLFASPIPAEDAHAAPNAAALGRPRAWPPRAPLPPTATSRI